MQPISPRQQSILNRVVDTHIETGEPVGSRFITSLYTGLYRRYYSPATVRHEMGVLEEKGYLTHPHTSAGRIPTDTGYRYYVDHGIAAEGGATGVFYGIRNQLLGNVNEIESFAEKASLTLSNLTEQVSMMLLPGWGSKTYQLFLRGMALILEKPEFQINKKRTSLLLRTLEDKPHLIDFLSQHHQGMEVRITIGNENQLEILDDCSVISAPIFIGTRNIGSLAVIGPRRMNYSRIISLVTQMADAISWIFSRTTTTAWPHESTYENAASRLPRRL